MPDWIETFVRDTEGISPESFRLWTGITIIAGALERRVWTETDKGILYPNLFTLLAGAPASGKTLMVLQARDFWTEIPGLFVGPDNPTKKSFLDFLQKSNRTYTNGSGAVLFCSLSMACREFGVLFQKGDEQFFGDMTDLYDNPPQFLAPRSTTSSVSIEKPTVNILAGVTPDNLANVFPEIAWGMGFTSRLLFIYGVAQHNPKRDPFQKRVKLNRDPLQKDLNQIFKLNGEFEWEGRAKDEFRQWLADELPPVPDYGRLVNYVSRREGHTWKLAMIAAVSRTKGLKVHHQDFLRAREWLLTAEKTMPDVFRSMRLKSDDQLIKDLHQDSFHKWSTPAIPHRKPLDEQVLWIFLQERTTSDRIPRLIETAYRSGLIRRGTTLGTFVPQPKT